jgi:hypothetical protein
MMSGTVSGTVTAGQDDRHVHGLGQVVDGGVGLDAVDFGPPGVDRVELAGEVPVQVLEDHAAQAGFGSPDHGDRLRREQPLHASLAGHLVCAGVALLAV